MLARYQPITPAVGQAGDQVDGQLGIRADGVARFGAGGGEGGRDHRGHSFRRNPGIDMLLGTGNPFGHLFAIKFLGLGRKT